MPRSSFGIIGAPMLFIGVYQLLDMMISPALPLIQREFAASPAEVAWVYIGSLLCAAISTPIAGSLADRYDKRLMLAGLAAIACTGVLIAGLAPNVAVLSIGQTLQGVGLGILPVTVGLFRDTLPPERVATGNGLVVGVGAFASALGLIISGPITTLLGFRWIFFLALIGLVAAGIWAWIAVPSTPGAAGGRIDWMGGALLAIGLGLLMFGFTVLSGSGLAAAWPLLGGSAVLLVAWAVVELRVADPLVDLRLLAGRSASAVTAIGFMYGFAAYGLFMALPLMLAAPVESGYGMGADASQIGLYLVPLGLAGTAIAPFVGKLTRVFGRRTVLVTGSVLISGGAAMPAFLHSSPWQVVVAVTLIGLGTSIGLTAALNVIAADVPAERAAGVSGVLYVAKTVGGSFGAQLGGLALALGAVDGQPQESGFVAAYLLTAAVGLLAALAAFAVRAKAPAAELASA